MSRAVSVVDTCANRAPSDSWQPLPKAAASRKYAVSSAGVSGVMSTDSEAWISLSPRQRTPSLAPTPRGSQLTRSYRLPSSDVLVAYHGRVDVPELPGPPKLNRSEPMRSSPVALARIKARSIVLPSGFAQSSGVSSVAHRHSSPGAGESLVGLQGPQSSFCEVSEDGSGVAESAESADELVPFVSPSASALSDEPPVQPVANRPAAAVRAAQRTRRAMSLPPSQAVRTVSRMAVRP